MIVKGAKKFSKSDIAALNMAAKLMLNLKEPLLAERIILMCQNGRVSLPLFNNIKGRREFICNNRTSVEIALRDCYFSYVGGDKFRFVTEKERLEPLMTVAGLLKTARKELHIPQLELARQLNCSSAYISRIERGCQELSLRKAMEIAQLLGMELLVTIKRKGNSPLLPADE
jgi:DNA-binding XRE family transcriptional regulator